MQNIITPRIPESLRNFDKKLLLNIRSRLTEVVGVTGLRWLVRRIRIEIWAWAKTIKELPKDTHGLE
jgi:hypothetical protein